MSAPWREVPMSSGKGQRQAVKSKHASGWQAQIREECLFRVQQRRSQLLSRCRDRRVVEDLASILSDVTQSGDTPSGTCGEARDGTPGQPHWLLSREDHEELLAEMEAALFDETHVEELEAIEAGDLDLVSTMFAAQSLSGGGTAVLCPVCESVNLTESAFGVVGCPREGFRIDAEMEGCCDTLASVGASIAAKLEEHRVSGCTEKPQFFVRETGSWTLYLACYTCGALEVVL